MKEYRIENANQEYDRITDYVKAKSNILTWNRWCVCVWKIGIWDLHWKEVGGVHFLGSNHPIAPIFTHEYKNYILHSKCLY